MAEKKVILLLAGNAAIDGAGFKVEKFAKKAAVVKNYTGGDVLGEAKALEGAVCSTVEELEAAIEKGVALNIVDLGSAAAADVDSAVEKALDAADRRTLTVLVGKDAVGFMGMGIDAKAGVVERAAVAKDIVPTIAFIADLPITSACTGAILYQVLKSPNLKLDEINKLKEALMRMESALQRDNREPWDKHDCA